MLRGRLLAGLRFAASSLLVAAGPGCQGEPADLGPAEPVDVPAAASPAEYPTSALIDLGRDEGPRQIVEGFSLPERVGARFASWSEGELSTVAVNLRGGAPDYLVAFLAEPYHRLGAVSVNVALNGHPAGEAQLGKGWSAYQLQVAGDRVRAGRNALSFQYSKTGRPSDFDPQSTDVRPLSVRFDQIQIAPIADRVQLGFGSNNALALAALGEGWARDPSDRGTGTWTLGKRALLTFHLIEPGAKASSPGYQLALTARAPNGVDERLVNLTLNGAPLGAVSFASGKSTRNIDVPAERLRAKNELGFEFTGLKSPAELRAESKDKRLLGLRVFELVVAPRDSAPAEKPIAAPASEPGNTVAEASRLK